MLNSIFIENFKCFKKQTIPLGQLTLFTGFNAAGKSSAIQTLLLGKQLRKDNNGHVEVPLNGESVKLGTVGDVKCHFTSEHEIKINYSTEHTDLRLKLDAKSRDKKSLPFAVNFHDDVSEIFTYLDNIIYISATRSGTLDVYPSPEEAQPIFSDVGELGQYAAWWFDQFNDEPILEEKLHSKETANTLRRQFNAWANELFPGAEANTQPVERTPLVRLELRTSKQEQWKRPSNIGYGLTYAFPILVAGLLSQKGQILIVDSPEAHLHPLGQSKIGYFLGMVANSGIQVILETHSDHVLNGVRLAVAKKVISNESVAIHFFTSSEGESESEPSICSPLMNEEGSLDMWPEGFFDQTEKDLAILNGWV